MSSAEQATSAAAPAVQTAEAGLLDQILDRTKPFDDKERERNKDYVGLFRREQACRNQEQSGKLWDQGSCRHYESVIELPERRRCQPGEA